MVSFVVPGTVRVPPWPFADCPYVPSMSDGSISTEPLAVLPHFFCQILQGTNIHHAVRGKRVAKGWGRWGISLCVTGTTCLVSAALDDCNGGSSRVMFACLH